MATVRINSTATESVSWFTEIWENVISCFKNEVNVISSKEYYSNAPEDIDSLCEYANSYLVPLASTQIQHLLDNIIQVNTIYEPEIAEHIIREENMKIEEIKGHIKGIHYTTNKMFEIDNHSNLPDDLQTKSILHYHTTQSYADKLKFHMNGLSKIL